MLANVLVVVVRLRRKRSVYVYVPLLQHHPVIVLLAVLSAAPRNDRCITDRCDVFLS